MSILLLLLGMNQSARAGTWSRSASANIDNDTIPLQSAQGNTGAARPASPNTLVYLFQTNLYTFAARMCCVGVLLISPLPSVEVKISRECIATLYLQTVCLGGVLMELPQLLWTRREGFVSLPRSLPRAATGCGPRIRGEAGQASGVCSCLP